MNIKQQGFSLIEVLVVAGIVGVLAAIAYPTYQEQVRESNRAEAHAELMRIADLQERFYLQNNAYSTNPASLGMVTPVHNTSSNFYTITVGSTNVALNFTITATAINGQLQDTDCPTINLTSAGVKGPNGCW